MNFIKFLRLCVAGLLLFSCNFIEEIDCSETSVVVPFICHFSDCPTTRSSVMPDDVIDDIVLMAYSEGVLIADSVFSCSDSIYLKLEKGRIYDFYALANVEDFLPPVSEDKLYSSALSVNPTGCREDSFPMSWSVTGCAVSGDSPIEMSFERLAAKVVLNVDSQVEGLEIVSAVLKQVPLSVKPFAPGGNKAEPGSVADGDYATDNDLVCLNNGESVSLYMPENMQGTLLESNHDPMMKVLEEGSEAAEVCSYLEVKCRFAEGFSKEGEVCYRMYLGTNNVSNFDVERNRVISVSLTLTEAGISIRDSWKIDAGAVQDAVKPPFAPVEICFNATDIVLEVGQTYTLKYKVRYNDGTSTGFISYGFAPLNGCSSDGWVVSNWRVADISAYGVITPKTPGRTTISMSISWWIDDVLHSSTAIADVYVLGEVPENEVLYVYVTGPAMFYNGSGGPGLYAVFADGTESHVMADWWETSYESVFYDEDSGMIVQDDDNLKEGQTICTFTASYQGMTASIDMLYGKWVKDVGFERVAINGSGSVRLRMYLVLDDFSRVYVPFAYRLSYDGVRWEEFILENGEGIPYSASGYYIELKTINEYYDYNGLSKVWTLVSRL